MFPFIKIFNISLPTYSICGLVGVIAALAFVFWQNKKFCLPKDDILHVGLFSAVGAIIGSKLLYIITALPAFIKNFRQITASAEYIFNFLQFGYVFYGGLIGAAIMAYWYCRRYKLPVDKVLALATPAIPLFHAFGRIGCFMAGCCWGIECKYGVAFTNSIAAPNGIKYLPIQLIEAALNLLLFAVLAILARKLKKPQNVFAIYVICYAVMRFGLEFLRGDLVRGVVLFSTSQWISLALIPLTVIMWIYFAAGSKKADKI